MTSIEFEDELEIRRPRRDVFAFLSDQEHLPAWNGGVTRARRTTPGPIGVGTTYRVVGKMLGRRVESTYELIAYDPDEMFAGRMVSRYFSIEETYRLEGDDGTTRLTVAVEAAPEGRLRLLGPLLAAGVPRQIKSDHRRLKSILERRPRRPPKATRAPAADDAEPAEVPTEVAPADAED